MQRFRLHIIFGKCFTESDKCSHAWMHARPCDHSTNSEQTNSQTLNFNHGRWSTYCGVEKNYAWLRESHRYVISNYFLHSSVHCVEKKNLSQFHKSSSNPAVQTHMFCFKGPKWKSKSGNQHNCCWELKILGFLFIEKQIFSALMII